MTSPVPLFVELCAGTAAVSLRLQGGRHARPPVSRMGAKTGYSTAILAALGLRPGQRAAAYLWCEPDPGCRAMLHAYTSPELLREAADIIRGWKDEEPRALWERLRAEGPIQGVEGREVARWVWLWGRSFNTMGPECGFLPSASANGVKVWNAHPVEYFGGRLDAVPSCPASIAPDARTVDPPTLPPGCVVYIDPPYQGTTGYVADLSRADVLDLARRWADAGATVAISEAEPVEGLGSGWEAVEITGERRGQKRTFSKQQAEWLTMNRAPACRPAVQAVLWGAA